jgi:hypothetical protein
LGAGLCFAKHQPTLKKVGWFPYLILIDRGQVCAERRFVKGSPSRPNKPLALQACSNTCLSRLLSTSQQFLQT